MKTGSSIFALLTLVVMGVIAADVLTHPGGTKVVLGGLGQFASTSYNAMLGRGTASGKGRK